MATKRQQERKKKAREQKARARVEARRHKLDAARREERRAAVLENRFREKMKPIVKDPEKARAMAEAEGRKVMERLQRNAEILKALEEEYERETSQKRAVNERLESEGHSTLQDKLGALEAAARAGSEDGKIEIPPAV